MPDSTGGVKTQDLSQWVERVQQALKTVFKELAPPPPLPETPSTHFTSPETTPLSPLVADPGVYCGLLRNNSIFGCNFLSSQGDVTKVGVDLQTQGQSLGLSLKIFFKD